MTPAAGDALAAAAGLRRRAVADLAGGRATRAVRDLTAALRLVTTAGPGARSPGGDRDPGRVSLHVACLLTMAVARLQTDGVSAAHRMLDEARTLAGDDDELITRWRTQRALVLGRSGELAAAEAELEVVSRHLDIFTPQERCSVLLNRGMVAVERARATDAIPLFAEAAEIATTYDLPRQRFMALHNAGYAAHLTGDLPAALAGMDAADAVEADVFRGPALLDRGRVLHEAGLLEESLEVLGEAAAVSGRRGHDLLRGEILLEIARVLLLLGDPVGATREARRARRRFVGAGAAGWVGRADVTILSARFVRGRGLAALAAEVDALERMAIAAGDVELQARTVCLAAEIAARRHDPGAGRAALARHPGGDLGLAARLVRAHASVAVSLAAGRPHLAEAILRRSASWLVSSQAGSASLDSRAARAVLGAALAAEDVRLAVSAGRPEGVMEALERWSVAGRGLPVVRPPADPEQAELAQSLRTVLRRLRDDPAAPAAPAWRREASLLRGRLRAAAHASAQTVGRVPPPRSGGDLLDQVRGCGRDLWWLFAVDGALWVVGTVDGLPLLRPVAAESGVQEGVRRLQADVRALPQRQHGPLRAAVQASLSSGLQGLAALAPVPTRPLVVVECPATAGLPWAMLAPLRGVPVTVARSVSEWVDRRRSSAGTVSLFSGPGLAHDTVELEAAAAAWSGVARVTVDPVSTAAGVMAALRYSEVVHVAAHGRHQPDSPLFSSLRLYDGELFAHELPHGAVRSGHVVLSACDVGAVEVRPGGETLGLAGALVSLGVASVVASVAPVADDAAAELMALHHQGLARGLESDAALAAASERVPAAATFVAAGSTWRRTAG